MLDATLLGKLKPTGFCQSSDNPSVAVRTQCNARGRFHQDPTRLGIHRRHGALLKNHQLLIAEPQIPSLGKVLSSRPIGRWTGHDEQRNRYAKFFHRPAKRVDMHLKKRATRYRTNRIHTLGLIKSQACSLTTSDQDHRHLTSRNRPRAFQVRLGKQLRCSLREPNRLGRLGQASQLARTANGLSHTFL